MKTYSVKPDDIKRENHVVDVADKVLGRVATEIASLLMGKHKPLFSRNADVGDIVTVINAEKIKVTGNKEQQKMYYRHSGYPGGFKSVSFEKLLYTHPERIIIHAVSGMLPHNHLHDRMMKRLKVYAGPAADKNAAAKVKIESKAKRPKPQIVFVPVENKSRGKK
jgi:large subunit ribosomal protein L13